MDLMLFGMLFWGIICIAITAKYELGAFGWWLFFGLPILIKCTSMAPIFFGVVVWLPLTLCLMLALLNWLISFIPKPKKKQEPRKTSRTFWLIMNTFYLTTFSILPITALLEYLNIKKVEPSTFGLMMTLSCICCYFISAIFTKPKDKETN